MKKEYDIFISYRREGGKEYARNLTSELVSRGFHPFLDFDELKDGKFDKRITDAIESAPVFMFILSPGSLDRCVNEDDWVRKEILHAIEHKRHIVPVDIDKQFDAFPSVDDFPQAIKDALGQHQFSQIQTETLYKVSIDEMVKNRIQPAIDEYMRERQKAAGMTGAEIHIETDMDCHVQRFHRDMIVAKVDEENVIHLPKGKHKLQFISVENPDVKDSCEYKVEDVTESDFIEVNLQEKVGVTTINNEELERLQQERDDLVAKTVELTNLLNEATIGYDKLSSTSDTTIHSLNMEKLHLQDQLDNVRKEFNYAKEEVDAKTKEIESLKKRLDNTQQALSKTNTTLQAYRDKEEKVGDAEFKMIYVEGGTYTMGATPEMKDPFDDEKNTHQVTLSSYYIGESLVTQTLWVAVMGNNPSRFKCDQNPVESVTWNDCQEFIKKLNQKTGKKFRLLTEAEWEFAARGGNVSNHTQYSGSNSIDVVAWYGKNSSSQTQPVKQKNPNELGIYDMGGNVCEWCQDWYGSYDKRSQTDPTGPSSGSYRVRRGGSWRSDARGCRLSCRYYFTPGRSNNNLGFRLALSE